MAHLAWASHLISLWLSFSACKMGEIIGALPTLLESLSIKIGNL